jgi:hypothetical protein
MPNKNMCCAVKILYLLSAVNRAALGAQLSILFPPQSLLLILAAMMFASGSAMLCNKNEVFLCDLGTTKHSPVNILAISLIVGIVTGMVSAGGGWDFDRPENFAQGVDKYPPQKFLFVHYFNLITAYYYRVTGCYSTRLVSKS